MVRETIRQAEEKMKKSVEIFRRDLAGIKAGRATPALLDKVQVEAYGTVMPISQVATITAPDARTLVIDPWDKSTMKAIEKAILNSDLGLNPNNDGKVIRLILPPLTEERRKELVKMIHKRAEEERVVIRNIRRDANEEIRKAEKAKAITEDESKRGQEEIQKLTDKYIKEVDQILAAKEKEIMEV
ncbi:MAG: ribosome recycling factor [Firmicutes bacterium]|nr:ribosome recycling factor [Bacillota bacterium]